MNRKQLIQVIAVARHNAWCPYNGDKPCEGPKSADTLLAETIADAVLAAKREMG